MKITREEVQHVADLAHLEMGEADIERFAEQIGQILAYVDTLNQVDTAGVPGTSHAISLTNAFRDDVETVAMERDRVLSNAPQKEDGNFVVPKVVG
jgi:aspartyl-tRNA(Asn)/glutamyl-tRNA(Gln) amidotransferase subunit C